jgi:hypothetical protein
VPPVMSELRPMSVSRPNGQRKDYRWLVEKRCDIQRLLSDLHDFGGIVEARADVERIRDPYHLLVGASFSLWRAVFLIEPDFDTKLVVEHSIKFVEKVVRDNTITFKTDQDLQAWSAGYYLNNAFFRIEELIKRWHSWHGKSISAHAAIAAFNTADRQALFSSDRQQAFEISCAALRVALDALKHEASKLGG